MTGSSIFKQFDCIFELKEVMRYDNAVGGRKLQEVTKKLRDGTFSKNEYYMFLKELISKAAENINAPDITAKGWDHPVILTSRHFMRLAIYNLKVCLRA